MPSYSPISAEAKEKLKNVQDKDAVETNFLAEGNFDAGTKLIMEKEKMYLEIALDKNWLAKQKRKLVTTQRLGKAIIPGLAFENPDGTPLRIETDYFGRKRNVVNPSPGPFEIIKSGKQRIRIW